MTAAAMSPSVDDPADYHPDEVSPGDGRAPEPAVITVTQWRVACDGDVERGLGHPRVWLRIPPETGFVECGYCDRRYVIDPERAEPEH